MNKLMSQIKNRLVKYFKQLYFKVVISKKHSNCYIHYKSQLSGTTVLNDYVVIREGAKLNNVELACFAQVNGSNLSNVKVGKFTSIASNCFIGGGGEHPVNQISTHAAFYSLKQKEYLTLGFTNEHQFQDKIKQVDIGNDVWIGGHCIVKQGVKVGDGAIIAAGSVVVKDVKAFTIVGGVPAKIIKNRFDTDLQDCILLYPWWELPTNKLHLVSKYFNESIPLSRDSYIQFCEETRFFTELNKSHFISKL